MSKLVCRLFVPLFSGWVGLASAVTYVPSDLSPGDSYRLVFVTAGIIDATSSNISFYNTFVQSEADLSGALTNGAIWKAMVSANVPVELNIGIRDYYGNPVVPMDIPLYRVDGVRVADDYADLMDGTLDAPIAITQFAATTDGALAWTGFLMPRTTGSSVSLCPLGSDDVGCAGSILNTEVGGWSCCNLSLLSAQYPLYAISDPLTVASVPLPEEDLPRSSALKIIQWKQVLDAP